MRKGIGIVLLVIGITYITLLPLSAETIPESLGVFCETDNGLIELSTYGKEIWSGVYELTTEQLDMIPQVNKIHSFIVNIPNLQIMESQVYWEKSLYRVGGPEGFELALSGKARFITQNHMPLKTVIRPMKNNMYKITCSDMTNKTRGFFHLKVSMHLGTPDRMYSIGYRRHSD